MNAAVDCWRPTSSSDQTAPIRASGMALMMVSGWMKDRKAGIREK